MDAALLLNVLEKLAGQDFAPGLPDPSRFGDVASLPTDKLMPWVVQEHKAQRAGRHLDVRFGPRMLFSWATKKELPGPGEKRMLYQQPLHCFPPSTKVLTDQGEMEIHAIVNGRLPVRVLSTDDSGNVCYRRVLNYWKRPANEDIAYLRVAVPFYRVKHLRCTLGHQLISSGKKVSAGDLHVNDMVDFVLPTPNPDQEQILLGGLLGDSSIDHSRGGTYRFGHSPVSKDYFYWKASALMPFFRTSVSRPRDYRMSGLPFLSASGPSGHSWFMDLCDTVYAGGVKTITRPFLNQISELGLAVWYQDDGSITKSGSNFNGCSFATHGFRPEEVELIQTWLLERFSLKTFKVTRGKNKSQYELRLNPTNALRLFRIIAGYVHPSMGYKLELPADWHRGRCRICGCVLPCGVGLCDECIRSDADRFDRASDHRRAYERGDTLVSPKTINNRFGTFAEAKDRTATPLLLKNLEDIPTFECGILLDFLCQLPVMKACPVRVVLKSVSKPRDHERYLYNLEIEDTHRYVVRGGFVVGNSGSYANFEGTIVSGYGKGTVKTQDKGMVIVTHADPGKIKFVVTHRRFPETYTMIRKSGPPAKPSTEREKKTQGGSWLLINTTPQWTIPHNKVHYTKVDAEDVEKLFDPKYLVTEKIDGAAALMKLFADKIEVLSYRTSTKGVPIIHSYRVGGTRNLSIPKHLVGSILRGEIYGVRMPQHGIELQPGIEKGLLEEIKGLQKKQIILQPEWVEQQGSDGYPAFTIYDKKGQVVGAVGSDLREDGEHYAQIYIKPEFRGKGFAGKAEELYAKKMGFTKLRATIRADNAASLSAHRKAGYRELGPSPDPNILVFEREYNLPKAIHPSELGGILNASVAKSLSKQEKQNIELKGAIFNVLQYGKKPVPMSEELESRLQKLREVMKHLPSYKFHLPESAETPEEARKLWETIVSGQRPRTSEGIVAWPRAGGKPVKVKTYPESDVHVREIFPGKKGLAGKGAGGFAYSLTPKGPVVGEVGTGFSQAVRREMMEDPSSWLGRVARIRSQEQLPSGAYRAPSFLALHEDYPQAKTAGDVGFPEEELPALRKRLDEGKSIYTTRISAERGKYSPGESYHSPLGRLSAVSLRSFGSDEEHPFIGELTEDQKAQIAGEPYDVVEFKSVGPDIPWKVGRSSIHGRGVIATGKIIGNTDLGIGYMQVNNTGVLDDDFVRSTIGRYLNHSENPNTKMVNNRVITTRDIEPNEELTLDYGSVSTGKPTSDKTPFQKKLVDVMLTINNDAAIRREEAAKRKAKRDRIRLISRGG